MSPFDIYFIIVYAINIALGFGVFATNHKRTTNQLYLLLSFIVALWLSSNRAISRSFEVETVLRLVQFASAIAIFIPASCHLLRLTILYPNDNWWRIIERARKLLLSCLAVALLCFSPYFVKDVRIPDDVILIHEPVYDWAFLIFTILFVGLVLSLLVSFARDRKRVDGFKRIELEFITIGYSLALLLGTVFGLVTTVITGSSKTVPMSNTTSILALILIMSYGIATKRILGIATILKKATSYALLTTYLVLIYLLVWKGLSSLFDLGNMSVGILPQLLAMLTVAVTMAPAQGKLQKVSAKLIATKTMNAASTMKKAGEIFQTVSTYQALQDQFTLLLKQALDLDTITILERKPLGFTQTFPLEGDTELKISDAMIEIIEKTHEPLYKDSLSRTRQTESKTKAAALMDALGASVAIGIFYKNELSGIVLFGPKLDGGIFDRNELDAIQILCNQFAVALENAQLYTEMQDSKIRNEIMLDQLVSGVIVAGPDRTITLFNHEAQRITGILDTDAIGKSIRILPRAIQTALESTLETKSGVRNMDATLYNSDTEEESSNIRMGSAFLFGHDDKPMGALLVFTDITELKGLEEQVRRTDQLSSVGTLAAGMAHEIKNPLVTIKTFTQLLPKRYNDEEFRQDFSSLVAHEVSRIDGIVNELLSFSKPAKPHLIPMKLQDTIAQTVKLTHEQRTLKNIELTTKYNAPKDEIFGDAKLLSQALINLKLNAIEAIGEGGSITIGTINCNYRFASPDSRERATMKKCIRLQITDTGKGIERENIQKIFDPFYTSKSEGTGMGLSVAHGIISEHHGVIEVESEPGRGTTFYVYIPVLEEGITK
jgi:two-component system nitrogen regulation sensor histidine kinase GlnL